MKLLFFLSALFLVSVAQGYGKRVMCYYTNWAGYRSGDGKFSVDDIDPNVCTHLIYSFAKVQGNGLAMTEGNDPEMYKKIVALKQQNPDLKVMLAVGGWNHPAAPFTQIVSTEHAQKEFVENSYQFLKQHGFDGLDLDWEYPADRGSPPGDRERFTDLMQKLSAKYKPEGLLLSAATPALPSKYDNSYEAEACQYLDFINMMTYDYGGHWDTKATHNSPLTAQRETAQHLLQKPGCTGDKLNLGMAAYGRTHNLGDPSSNGIDAPTERNGGISGPYTQEAGFLSYYEVCQKLKEGWTRGWSDEQQVPYAYSNKDWVGYDDPESIAAKAALINELNLGGAMFWAMDLDDFSGKSCNEGKFPLINAAKGVLNGQGHSTRSTTARTTPATTASPTEQSASAAFYCVNSREKQTYANVSDNCQSYYDCLTTPAGKQITVSRSCPATFIYVEEQKKCVKEKDITNPNHKCSTKLGLPAAPLSSPNCWDPASTVADSMCRFYTDCSTKRRYECPQGSLFDRNSKRCVPKQQVQCWW